MAVEHEFKFSPGPLFQIPDLSTVKGIHPDAADTIRLQATYFDTDDFRLSRAGASLRYRTPEGWTVKLPVAVAVHPVDQLVALGADRLVRHADQPRIRLLGPVLRQDGFSPFHRFS